MRQLPSRRAWILALAAIAPAIGVLWALGALETNRTRISTAMLAWFVFVAPLLEEAIFRGGLQEMLLRRHAEAFGPLSLANVIASLVFAAAHLVYHQVGWALAVILPSLVFGYFYERGRRLWRPILLHAIYNAVFFGLAG